MNQPSTTQSVYDLLDGQVQRGDLARVVALVATNPEARSEWKLQHVVGESMRRGAQVAVPMQPDLASQVMARIASSDFSATTQVPVQPGLQLESTKEAANSPWFDRRMVAGFALFALIGSVVWFTSGPNPSGSGTQLSQQTQPPVKSASSAVLQRDMDAGASQPTTVANAGIQNLPVMIRDPHLDALMAAHKQFGGTSALQKPAGFVRNATFEGPAR